MNVQHLIDVIRRNEKAIPNHDYEPLSEADRFVDADIHAKKREKRYGLKCFGRIKWSR